jgi:two-component system phosphate regulon response regulator PhoB
MTDRILIADDEPGIAGALASILEDEGYAVTRAADGAEALALCERDGPDLLITDQMMPNLTGVALIARLRQRERAARPAPRPLPIILMSAALSVAATPPTVFLAKPFDVDHLLALVARLLAR